MTDKTSTEIEVSPDTYAAIDNMARRRGVSHSKMIEGLLAEDGRLKRGGKAQKPDPRLVNQTRQLSNLLGQSIAHAGTMTRPKNFVEDPPDRPGPKRTFFHFTSLQRMPLIACYGVNKGDVPITPAGGFNAPWLTVHPRFDAQRWVTGSNEDKSFVRLTFEVAEDDPCLRHWPELAKAEGMDDFWFDALNKAGGEHPDAHKAWWIYMGILPVRWITAVDTRIPHDPNPEAGFAHAGSSGHLIQVVKKLVE